eukprot:NODE_2772_length_506_cov_40.965699_g2722_i0.p1 GENE.NODE_2772_length_506_cov_40.965699_g2722_i0~~NODE_2772_length_506_cov_40.965699_g2722_i0.p1  ORF type:complete len:125 (+),score=25.13 NODE_2772_length_506_cov_40.965699_g2722_i0:77-451(+)
MATAAGPTLSEEDKRQLRVQTNLQNEKYLRAHPEVQIVLSKVTNALLTQRPERHEILPFIQDFIVTNDLHAIVSEHERLYAVSNASATQPSPEQTPAEEPQPTEEEEEPAPATEEAPAPQDASS